jgi:dinuclear metal center YbgI/SA1388 family protein
VTVAPQAPSVGELIATLERWFEPRWAEPWDNVGLVVGDPLRPAASVHIAVDPTRAVAQEAVALGADLLVTHHPLWLDGICVMTGEKGHAYRALEAARCALYVAHTNADVANPGVSDALAAALGLVDTRPLPPAAPAEPADERTGPVRNLGERPLGLGRVGTVPSPRSLRAFVAQVADALPATAAGVRATGDPDCTVRTVAVAGGACLGLAEQAAAAGADVLVTSDAKHHRAQEAPLPVVDVPHWAGEWPWTAALAERLRQSFPAAAVTVSALVTDPWTLAAGATSGTV